ncbi:ATP-binding cassette domain-containing protein [Streptomyces sp. NPDC091215]|uniref:ATP-binding cassette domain-containing protein n=1 Tax=Streptomyces sp. NPDC091215 TaxID=3155192 RepID=UPI00343855FF
MRRQPQHRSLRLLDDRHHGRDALDRGIATVHQDLAVVPLMPVWRNFFLGSGPRKGLLKRLDVDFMRRTTHAELRRMGIDLRDVDQPIGTLSGGERQCVAIARAVYFGAKVLILDEPTAALGVKQSGVVLKYLAAACDQGLGVVLITHNPHHAYLVGDRFVLLRRGAMVGSHSREEITLDELTRQMAGGSDLESLRHELQRGQTNRSGARGAGPCRSAAPPRERDQPRTAHTRQRRGSHLYVPRTALRASVRQNRAR